ncbi:hypothetical protein [Anaerosacchariphilus polymeriproducens]|nr:hypothetical protein [Anaerosacchariphilus polymeriproducens]
MNSNQDRTGQILDLKLEDYGRIDVNEAEMTPYAESGALWKVTKDFD